MCCCGPYQGVELWHKPGVCRSVTVPGSVSLRLPPTTFAVPDASGNACKVSPSLLHLAAFLALKLFVFAVQTLLLRNQNRAGKENNEHRCLGGAARHVAGGEPVPCLSINTATAFCKHMPLCGGFMQGLPVRPQMGAACASRGFCPGWLCQWSPACGRGRRIPRQRHARRAG